MVCTFKRQKELNFSDKEYKKMAKEITSFVCGKWITFTYFHFFLLEKIHSLMMTMTTTNDFLSELFLILRLHWVGQ